MQTTPHRRRFKLRIWWLALGYFAFYAPYSFLIKVLTTRLWPGVDGPVSGFQILPAVVIATAFVLLAIITLQGWWKYASRGEFLGRRILVPPADRRAFRHRHRSDHRNDHARVRVHRSFDPVRSAFNARRRFDDRAERRSFIPPASALVFMGRVGTHVARPRDCVVGRQQLSPYQRGRNNDRRLPVRLLAAASLHHTSSQTGRSPRSLGVTSSTSRLSRCFSW